MSVHQVPVSETQVLLQMDHSAPARTHSGPGLGQTNNSFSLPNTKTIELIGEEFVQMKSEPQERRSEPEVSRPSVVMSVSLANSQEEQAPAPSTASEQQNLVYCNLNDLDFGPPSDSSSFALVSTSGLAETQTSSITTSANQQLLQIVQAVPGLQITSSDKNPYSAVSNILLQGGILQVRYLISTRPHRLTHALPMSKPNLLLGCCVLAHWLPQCRHSTTDFVVFKQKIRQL